MALSKDKIIQSALRLVGQTYHYNDNNSEIYKMAGAYLENIIDSVAYRTDLKFNSTTVSLTVNGKRDEEFRYNIPTDYLNKVLFIGGEAYFEGEYIYSLAENLKLQYMRRITLPEFPDNMFELLSHMLALRLAESDISFRDSVQLMDTRVNQELTRLYQNQFTPKTRKM